MQTIGYWCDECRVKYVNHLCKEALPCGHDKSAAVRVSAQAFGRGGESVHLSTPNWSAKLFITRKTNDKSWYASTQAKYMWGFNVEIGGEVFILGAWLNEQEEKIIRALDERWQSSKHIPFWRTISTMSKEGVAAMSGLTEKATCEESLSL